jgi:hypothetical protein
MCLAVVYTSAVDQGASTLIFPDVPPILFEIGYDLFGTSEDGPEQSLAESTWPVSRTVDRNVGPSKGKRPILAIVRRHYNVRLPSPQTALVVPRSPVSSVAY